MKEEIIYKIENELSYQEFKLILVESTLGERRPVENEYKLRKMCQNANLILTARTTSNILVGVARSLTDFSFCTYLSDLAVHVDYQSHGIGKKLINKTLEKTKGAMLILLAAPKAIDYYPKVGMEHFEHTYIKKNE